MPTVTRFHSRYAPSGVKCGIVHVGLGAFHRAHQAVYIEAWLNNNGGGQWGICAANIRSNRELVDQLERQGCRYHVVEYRDRQHVSVREISAIRHALFAGDSKEALLARMAAPDTRIVTLTVTEKAYRLSPADGRLLIDDPDVLHDIAHPAAPKTVPGVLLEALRVRRELELPAFTIVCCDNMPENGARTASACVQLAERQQRGVGGRSRGALADWVRSSVAFPSTMVDRIVPAVTGASHQELTAVLGFDDPAAVRCEAFSQWVIEDRFPSGRPDWETVGVQMVDDVRPFETMKLRLLNGSHSLLAYVGLLRGHATVAQAIADPALGALVHRYLDEARATLKLPSGVDVRAYERQLLARFGNDSLEHRLIQIAMDGSQKLPQRWLQGALWCIERGLPLAATAVGVAAWIHHVRGKDLHGRAYLVDDPLAGVLARCHAQASSLDSLVASVLELRDVFPEALARDAGFTADVKRAYVALSEGAGLGSER